MKKKKMMSGTSRDYFSYTYRKLNTDNCLQVL